MASHLSEGDEAWVRYGQDPVGWVRNILQADPWDAQVAILESVRDNRRTAVRSAHGLGKTAVAAMVVLWYLSTHWPAIVITTAPTWHQVRNLLWREIEVLYGQAIYPLGGRLTQMRLELEPNWYALGLSTNKPERFQGYHSENMLLVVDEASGVDEAIFAAAEGFLTGIGARVLLIGNPTQVSGTFYQAFKSPLYTKFHLSAFDSPNVTEGKIVRPYLTTLEWIEEKRAQWGEGTPLWFSRVLGEFPEMGEDMVIPLMWAERAMEREAARAGGIEFGVDVARYGVDKSAVAIRQGQDVLEVQLQHKFDVTEVAGWVAQLAREWRPTAIKVDCDGIGAGVHDILEEQGFPVVEIHGGARPNDPEQFINKRAEWYWGLRERLDPQQGGECALPAGLLGEELLGQLTGLKFAYTSRGQVKVESKDDMRKRGLPSPDLADAVVYAFAEGNRSFLIGAEEARGRTRMPQWAVLVEKNESIPVRSEGGLPIPFGKAPKIPLPQAPRCPNCGQMAKIHTGAGDWLCRNCGHKISVEEAAIQRRSKFQEE